MTMLATPKAADDVRAQVNSPETTTISTLNILRAILGLELVVATTKVPPELGRKAPARRPPAKTKPAARTAKSKADPKFEIYEAQNPAPVPLALKDRKRLATETFNVTLKTLSNAARVKQQEKAEAPANTSPKGRRDHDPLQDCAPNGKAKNALSSKKKAAFPDLGPTAQCSTAALDCLRQLHEQANTENPVDLGLENGGLVLLDKLITLQLREEADHQSCRLYEQYWKRRKNQKPPRPVSNLFARLYLPFAIDPAEHKFVTTLQGQLIRLAILEGPASLDDHTANHLQPQRDGSPAWMIMDGHRRGLLTSETAGGQLRTLSLALSKLQSLIPDRTAAAAPQEAIRLAAAALQIKCMSWKLVDHKPELARELWTPLGKVIQKATKAAKTTAQLQKTVEDCVTNTLHLLKENGFSVEVPKTLQRYCSVTQQASQNASDVKQLQSSSAKERARDSTQLLASFQFSLACLDSWKEQAKTASTALRNCLELVPSNNCPRSASSEELIAMSQLRKAAVSAADEIVTLQRANFSTDEYNELHVCLVRAVFASLSFCHSSNSAAPNTDSIGRSQAILCYAKTMEAVLHLEQHMVTRSVLLEDETHRVLDDCLDFVSALLLLDAQSLSPAIAAFIPGVPGRISHAYWSRYLLYTENNRPLSIRIDALNRSVRCVENGSQRERSSAMLSLKHEKLSSLWFEQKSFPKAQASLASAIDTSIEQGVLTEFTTVCLTQVIGIQSADNKSPVYRFGQVLAKYVDLSLKHNVPNSKGTWYFDSHSLDGIERAVLLETQLLTALSDHAMALKSEQVIPLVSLWEQLCREPKYRVYQLRSVSNLLHVLAKQSHLDTVRILDRLLVLQEALPEPLPKDTVIVECVPLLSVVGNIQWALACHDLCEELLKQLWEGLHQVLKQCSMQETPRIVADPSILSSTMTAVADYAGVLGLPQIQLETAEIQLKLCEIGLLAGHSKRSSWLLVAAMAHIELNQTTEAGKALAAAEILGTGESMETIRWSLGSAEYHFSIGNAKRSRELLESCEDIFGAVTASNSRERLDQEVNLGRAALLTSQIALRQGDLGQAMQYARQAVKLTSGMWSSLEKTLRVTSSPQLVANDTTLSSLTHDLRNLDIDDYGSGTSINAQGVKYWSAVNVHRNILRHAASLSAHNGVYQDALFFAQQAAKVTSWTGCHNLRQTVLSELAVLYAGAQEKGSSLALFPSEFNELDLTAALNYAEASLRLNDPEKARSLLNLALSAQGAITAGLKRQPGKAKSSASAKRGKPASRGPVPRARKSTATPVSTSTTEVTSKPALTVLHRQLQSRLNALKDELLVSGLAKNEIVLPADFQQLDPIEIVSKASVFVHAAMQSFATDPANNAIAETALALPVRYRTARKSGHMSLLLESPTKSNRQPSTGVATDGDGLLQQAYDWLRITEASSLPALSSARVTLLHQLLSRVVLLSTALQRPLSFSPLSTVLQSLRPKDSALYRERCVILAEQQTAERQQVQQWPSLQETSGFQHDYSDLMQVLPASWTILSLGLSSDAKELLLSKITKERSPFLMRLPLERPGVDSDEPCEFTLMFAKEELKDIVKRANATAHDVRGQGDKSARKEWYAEREQLDKRMEILLTNIENIWLGGFRGLFSPTSTDETLLARFGESLVQTLEKHLPSRQKKAKNKSKVDLHAHVLELFTSVAFEEADADFEDAVTDLLYFVVDILQFNGEANAFDEIDFDAMLMETIDALRGYHASSDRVATQHSILVIDKELQAFPWESLPCLRGRPASRMPSLSAIKERLDHMNSELYTIPRSGSYILNPSNDLPNTQATFETLLSQLPFESLIGQSPTEANFASLLENNSILLYFGHGAGTQYIRGRTIRKMPKCALTWLMGCSSAKLTECGVFESYGVPWHYMHAGSPAVVGTLWDVTDRDIDRFAVRALGDWGLMDTEAVEEGFWGRKGKKAGKDVGRRNGKGRANQSQEGKAAVPLDTAVAGARDACLLRYLNGAAVVVYGVPVSLE